jgi:biopolymer transport protein ExbB/TolQ
MIRFHCSKCAMKLMVEPEYAGSNVTCPSCGLNLTVPAAADASDVSAAKAGREGWKETDPTNPNIWIALGIGVGVFVLIYLLALPFKYTKGLLYERGWVQFAETFFFGWGVAFLVLKLLKIRHQQSALRLDVLPVDIAREIAKDNVSSFIQHVYSLPVKLRDSLMVNRIRKALELFETRQVNAEVSTMMSNQSNIDGARIGGSYTLVKVFIWAIPILGFIGTVIGLSDAIGNFAGVMSPEAIKDSTIMMKSMGGVTGGLATAFDTTLLGLIYALFLTLPMSSLQKLEEDTLTNVDAYCNENFLPRLNDGSGAAGGDSNALADTLTASITRAHTQFLTGLDAASKMIREQSQTLEKRSEENNKAVQEQFTKAIAAFNESGTKTLSELGKSAGTSLEALTSTLKKAADQVGALEKVAQTQQATIDASVKQSLSKLHEDSSKVIGEAVKIAVGETAKSIEGVIKPAVQQVSTLSDAVKAATVHVASLEKQASEHQSNVQKAMQESIAKVQQDSSKLLGESIRATADQSAKAMEEVMKPAVSQLASIGETAKNAVQEAANLQRQAREQHSSAHKAFLDTTAQLQRELSKTLEDSIRPATQQLGSLASSVKSAADNAAAIERQAREQQAANDRVTQEAVARLQRDAVKAFEDALRPAAQHLATLGETVKNALSQVSQLERASREAQTSAQQAAIESARQMQRDTAKSIDDTLRPVAQQLTALTEAVRSVTTQLGGLDRAAQDAQANVARAVDANLGRVQQDVSRAADEAMRTANQHLSALAQGITALNQTLNDLNGKQIVVQQVSAPAKGGFFSRLAGKG